MKILTSEDSSLFYLSVSWALAREVYSKFGQGYALDSVVIKFNNLLGQLLELEKRKLRRNEQSRRDKERATKSKKKKEKNVGDNYYQTRRPREIIKIES